jgi:hypothetical protein
VLPLGTVVHFACSAMHGRGDRGQVGLLVGLEAAPKSGQRGAEEGAQLQGDCVLRNRALLCGVQDKAQSSGVYGPFAVGRCQR